MTWKITDVKRTGDTVKVTAEKEVPLNCFGQLLGELPAPRIPEPKEKPKEKKAGKKPKAKAAVIDKKARQHEYYVKHQAKKEAAEKAAPDDDNNNKLYAKAKKMERLQKKIDAAKEATHDIPERP